MEISRKISEVLLIIGGLNWGLYGLWGVDLVAYLPGILATIVYVLVGIAAIIEIVALVGGEKKSSPVSEPMQEVEM